MFEATPARRTGSVALMEGEYDLLARVESHLAHGLALYDFWRKGSEAKRQFERFTLVEEYRGHSVDGFRGNVQTHGMGLTPVIGAIQKIPFARTKPLPGKEKEAARWMCRQMQAFTFRHFMSVTGFTKPQNYPQLGHLTLPPYLQPFSWCPAKGVIRGGVSFYKAYYKRRDGSLGKFPERDRSNFGNLQELGNTYDWIIVKSTLFDDPLIVGFSGPGSPRLAIPSDRTLYFVLSPDMVFEENDSHRGLLGDFGFALILLGSRRPSWEIYLPVVIEVGFRVFESGEVLAKTLFLGRQPRYDFKPLAGFYPVANQINLSELLKPAKVQGTTHPVAQCDHNFLLKRSMEIYNLIIGIIPAWNECPDWLRGPCPPPPTRRSHLGGIIKW